MCLDGRCLRESVGTSSYVVGGGLMFLFIALTSAAGIGGAGILVPICIIFYKYSSTEAIAMTNWVIFMSALG